MLVLSRKKQECIVIDGRIRLTIVKIDANSVRVGIDAPQDVSIVRGELLGAKPARQNGMAEVDPAPETVACV